MWGGVCAGNAATDNAPDVAVVFETKLGSNADPGDSRNNTDKGKSGTVAFIGVARTGSVENKSS